MIKKRKLTKIEFEASKEDLFAYTGLSLAGVLLHKTNILERFDQFQLHPSFRSPDIPNGDIIASYIGLLCQGRNDFDDIELYREDEAFALTLGISDVPSSPTLRQRLDSLALKEDPFTILREESSKLLKVMGHQINPITVSNGKSYIPVDVDVSPMDNGNSKKEGVGRTYKGCDGYSPIFAYIGKEGFLLNNELRKGTQHVQKGTPEFLKETLEFAKMVTNQSILVRVDGGNDSSDNVEVFQSQKVRFILKCNRRKESLEDLLELAKKEGTSYSPRDGKTVYIGERTKIYKGCQPVRQVYRMIERTIDKNGQVLLVPDIEAELYSTNLGLPVEEIIDLYHDHGTSEQFHSEIKTDLDLEQLPSGKFKTNALILLLGQIAYNLLRFIGQESLNTPSGAGKKTKVKRRRIRTVIQDIMIQASKVVTHARRKIFKLSCSHPRISMFRWLYAQCCKVIFVK